MKTAIKQLFFVIFIINQTFGQTHSIDWIKYSDNYQKTGAMMARDKSNNVIVAGHIQSQNIYTVKYNKFGDFQWEKTSSSGIQSVYEKAVWVNTDANKNIFVVGYQYSISSGNDYPSAIVALKYSTAGALLWKKTIPNNNYISFNVRSEVDINGNLYISTSNPNQPGFALIKLNPVGDIVFNNASGTSGGAFYLNAMRLKGNRIAITGREGVNTAAVVNFDTTGNVLWKNILLGKSGNDVEIDATGNTYVLTSYTNQVSANSQQDVIIYKIGPTGTQLWKKNYDFIGYDTPRRFTLVSNKLSVIGQTVPSGQAYSNWLAFQINTAGTKLWSATYSGSISNDEYPSFVAAKTNGEVFVTGVGGPSADPSQSSGLRTVTLKYSSLGATQWVDTSYIYGGIGLACTLASDNSLFVMSSSKMTAYHFLDHSGTGSCGVPSTLSTSNITNSSIKFSWGAVTGAYLYHLKYKSSTATDWTTISTNLTYKNITSLTPGTTYSFAVEAICNSGPSGYSASQTVSTIGNGYCLSSGLSTAQEYMNVVWVNSFINSSQSNNGYGDFTNLNVTLTQGQLVNGYLSSFAPYNEVEYYSIWIDYNHDYDFNDAGEQVVNFTSQNSGYLGYNFTVPTNVTPGLATRMRVAIKHGGAPSPCGTYDRGETEDFTVIFAAAASNLISADFTASSLTQSSIFPNPFNDNISVRVPNSDSPLVLSIYDITGKVHFNTILYNTFNDINLSELSNGIYFAKIQNTDGNSETFKIIKR